MSREVFPRKRPHPDVAAVELEHAPGELRRDRGRPGPSNADRYGCFDLDLFGPPVPGAASQLGPMSTPFTK
jgi:hypothetical protein